MQKDKLKHFIAGALIVLLLFPIFGAWAVIISIWASALKEAVWDYYLKKGTPEVEDFMAGVAGALAAWVIVLNYDALKTLIDKM